MPDLQLKLEDEHAVPFAKDVIVILNSVFRSESPKSSIDAATDLDSLCPRIQEQTTGDDTAVGGFLWWFWDLLHDLARQIPHDSLEQDQLAAVIKSLHDLPPKTVRLGEEWGSDNCVQLWTGLPMFGNTLLEKFNSQSTSGEEPREKERAVNVQAYAARITGLCHLPLEMYAIWALVDALEGTMTHIRGAPDEVNDDPTAVDDIRYKLQSAAAWIVHAGHLLYGRDEQIHGATAGPLWKLNKSEATKLRRKLKGTDGLCPQRWELWKDRFAAVRDAEGLDEEIRKRAEYTYHSMVQIEKEKPS